ncbi:hypothetical protein G6F65_015204 [Rhizopus arrhizus]|uniref:Uncharacterized protein n=1 Tax=Rhizopus delemar TaxID=936053 RepID=A0A9P6YAB7_9FUNG|nr:hypothetical protein G6F24_014953 [Rhizopus arrhizus]KAG0922841.1 hypothetical protein G6F32_014497 [Rhizopus arrhizus]KAG1259812.1 hypothetical protein G6F65_015204 [Rhizopus arrhizus]KAG1543265.1 hypothetical protein G6F50_014011 [Rhizopus delemar]
MAGLAGAVALRAAGAAGHRLRRSRHHPGALRQPPHRLAVAAACGASQRHPHVRLQRPDEASAAPGGRSSGRRAAAAGAGPADAGGVGAGIRHCHPAAVAALQRGHAPRRAGPGDGLGAAAPLPPHALRHRRRCQFRFVPDRVGSPAGNRLRCTGLSATATRSGHRQPAGLSARLSRAAAGSVP